MYLYSIDGLYFHAFVLLWLANFAFSTEDELFLQFCCSSLKLLAPLSTSFTTFHNLALFSSNPIFSNVRNLLNLMGADEINSEILPPMQSEFFSLEKSMSRSRRLKAFFGAWPSVIEILLSRSHACWKNFRACRRNGLLTIIIVASLIKEF